MTLSKPLIFAALELEARALEDCGPGQTIQIVGLRACRMPKSVAEGNPTCIIMAGIAGALDPGLSVGDIVLDDAAGLIDPVPAGWRRGEIYTSDNFIATGEEKAELFRTTGAPAVDMENAIVRRAAEEAKIPFIGLRAISDTADQGIDPEVITLTDEIGRINMMAVGSLLMRRPWIMMELTRLKADSQRALTALSKALKELLS